MASGGMGDVLTGMIVSFMAQGYDSLQASILAVYIHGLCGEKAKGNVCTASELAKSISKVVKKFLNEG
jgi:NAD(P)H-hydrate epimerase